jgi:hypothetical protein
MFQNSGVQNVGIHNHVFEQWVDFFTTGTDNLLHERVFGIFVENALSQDFLLIFGSGTTVNLNTDVHLPVEIDNSGNLKEFSITTGLRMFISPIL